MMLSMGYNIVSYRLMLFHHSEGDNPRNSALSGHCPW